MKNKTTCKSTNMQAKKNSSHNQGAFFIEETRLAEK
jgi:hypothetical protein